MKCHMDMNGCIAMVSNVFIHSIVIKVSNVIHDVACEPSQLLIMRGLTSSASLTQIN